jgi:hypothetical protein
VHTLLVRKFYFDELYGLVLVGGTHLLKNVSYASTSTSSTGW